MSRQIDTDQPLSPEDREYLLERGRRYLVLQNDRRFKRGEFAEAPAEDAPSPAPQETEQTPEQAEWERQVNELKVQELKDELSNRGLPTTGNQPELRARLIEAGPES